MYRIEIIFLVIISTTVLIGGESRYEQLEKNGFTCRPNDTCTEEREEDVLTKYRCQCGYRCLWANSCCIDSPYIRYMKNAYRHEGARCQLVPGNRHLKALIVDKCHEDWDDMLTKFVCEKLAPFNQTERDPLLHVPVTSNRSKTTYRNYHCAKCNYDEETAIRWEVTARVSVTGTEQSVRVESMEYDEKLQRHVVDVDGKKELVEIIFRPSEKIKDTYAVCIKDLISDCASDWTDEKIKKMCHRYMSVVFIPDGKKRYRNVFCAICNHVDYDQKTLCQTTKWPIYVDSFDMDNKGLLTLLVDVNWNDGEKVGNINRCGEKRFYDPIFKACRDNRCIFPGYVRNRNNVCVKSSR